MNEQKNALPGSTVYLLNQDSMVVKSGAANASGIFEFKDLGPGKYLVRASQTGYNDGYSSLVDLLKNALKLRKNKKHTFVQFLKTMFYFLLQMHTNSTSTSTL